MSCHKNSVSNCRQTSHLDMRTVSAKMHTIRTLDPELLVRHCTNMVATGRQEENWGLCIQRYIELYKKNKKCTLTLTLAVATRYNWRRTGLAQTSDAIQTTCLFFLVQQSTIWTPRSILTFLEPNNDAYEDRKLLFSLSFMSESKYNLISTAETVENYEKQKNNNLLNTCFHKSSL